MFLKTHSKPFMLKHFVLLLSYFVTSSTKILCMGQSFISLKSAPYFRKMCGFLKPSHSQFCTQEGREAHFELKKR